MKAFKPDYYNEFKCIAGACKHSCCIGWEIDVDANTLEYYNGIEGEMGSRLRDNIEDGHFSLDANERCPFLSSDGLCDIITELGADALCRICDDHPRFRNFYSDAVEIGLGLCCEEAARLILSQQSVFTIATYSEDESGFFKLRQTVFDIMQDREFSFTERAQNLCDYFDIGMPDTDWQSVYLELEILDDSWKDMLHGADFKADIVGLDTVFEQLFCYFIFRHLAGAIYDGLYLERIRLAILGCKTVYAIAKKHDLTLEAVADAARAFSSEIEYSDENVNILLEKLTKG